MRLRTSTPRMQAVEKLVAQGYTNAEIGKKLFLSEKTIKNMVSDILWETHTRNRTELALMSHNIIPQSYADRIQAAMPAEIVHPTNWDRS
jgi:two-component system response regulator DevR